MPCECRNSVNVKDASDPDTWISSSMRASNSRITLVIWRSARQPRVTVRRRVCPANRSHRHVEQLIGCRVNLVHVFARVRQPHDKLRIRVAAQREVGKRRDKLGAEHLDQMRALDVAIGPHGREDAAEIKHIHTAVAPNVALNVHRRRHDDARAPRLVFFQVQLGRRLFDAPRQLVVALQHSLARVLRPVAERAAIQRQQ